MEKYNIVWIIFRNGAIESIWESYDLALERFNKLENTFEYTYEMHEFDVNAISE
jgi:hypothetical protein